MARLLALIATLVTIYLLIGYSVVILVEHQHPYLACVLALMLGAATVVLALFSFMADRIYH